MSQPMNGTPPPRKFYSDADRQKLRDLMPDSIEGTKTRFSELFWDIKRAKDNGVSIAKILRTLKSLGIEISRGTFERWFDTESKARVSGASGSDSNPN